VAKPATKVPTIAVVTASDAECDVPAMSALPVGRAETVKTSEQQIAR
jgi:hypothetical protein